MVKIINGKPPVNKPTLYEVIFANQFLKGWDFLDLRKSINGIATIEIT